MKMITAGQHKVHPKRSRNSWCYMDTAMLQNIKRPQHFSAPAHWF